MYGVSLQLKLFNLAEEKQVTVDLEAYKQVLL
jgi:hypothetical protein